MPELGTKHECEECGAKFYDLGKSEVRCPKCEWSPDGGAKKAADSKDEEEE